MEHSAVVVDARPAGASVAAHLARPGRRVVAPDHSRVTSDQLATSLVVRSGVDESPRLGASEGLR